MSAVEKALRGCAITAGALIALVVAMVLWYFHSLGPGPQPDVGKAARSATAETADQAVTAQVDDRIGRLRTALPWATYLGTAVADVCSTEEKPIAFVGVHESWLPVTCTRTDTLYEAFDGDFRQHLAELDTVLADAGWRPGDLTLVPRRGGTPGLAAYFDRMHEPPRDPSPSEIARAAAEPNAASMFYTVPITRDYTPPAAANAPVADHPTRGRVEVTQAPRVPSLDGGQNAHDTMLRYPSVKTSYYRTWQPYSPAQVAAAYPAHGAVIAIELDVSYGTSPAVGP